MVVPDVTLLAPGGVFREKRLGTLLGKSLPEGALLGEALPEGALLGEALPDGTS